MSDPDICACGSELPRTACCEAAAAVVEAGRGQAAELLRGAKDALGRGALDDAARLLTRSAVADPRGFETLALLAGVRRKQGRAAAVIALMRRLMALRPLDPAVRSDLAQLLLESGDLGAADQEARACLRLAPDRAPGHTLMATIMAKRSRPEFAEWHGREALRLGGATAASLEQLASNLVAGGKLAEARELYRTALVTSSTSVPAMLGLAKLEMADFAYPAAAEALGPALARAPDDANVLLTQARLLGRTGDPERAVEVLDRAIATHGSGHPRLGFERGRLLDRLGRYDEAFASVRAARETLRDKGHRYRADEVEARLGAMTAFFTKDRMASLPCAREADCRPRPIFIMGFPRSGTTLVEQILSAHSKVAAGDELPLIQDLVVAAPRLLNTALPYPFALTELWMADRRHIVETMRKEYLDDISRRGILGPGQTHVTDKMPLNEIDLGLIMLVFPRSPCIRLVRHPLDVVLSVYFNWLGFADRFDSSLMDAARHYSRVAGLVEHYQRHFGEVMLTVRYEDLVVEFRDQTKRLLAHAGLPFEESCFQPERNSRHARTPSSVAVREKPYDRAKFRYKNYIGHLGEAIDILNPVIQNLGYDV